MGMTVSGEKGASIFLRSYDDYERYSLKLTASKTNGMGHVAFRTRSPQAAIVHDPSRRQPTRRR
jgi:catechol 2,3-dioxygenase